MPEALARFSLLTKWQTVTPQKGTESGNRMGANSAKEAADSTAPGRLAAI